MLGLIRLGGQWEEQVRNITNIMTLKDHSENIGVYYYISIEVFADHLQFFLIAYQVFSFVIQC